jgi:hypothetical protein
LGVKSFSPAVGGGRWENFLKEKDGLFNKKVFSFRGGMSEVGGWWRIKKFSAVKISVCVLGACGSDGICSAVGIFCD